MLNKAVEWGYLKDNPYKGTKMLKLTKKPARYLTVEEMQRLLDNASPWLKPMLFVLRNTGIRVHELLNLKWHEVDFDRQCITARSDKTRNYRVIPITQELTQTLHWLRDNYIYQQAKIIPRQESQLDYVFCDPDGTKLKRMQHGWYNCCKKAGITANLHMFRHSFASHLVMNGVDLPSVKELLGHTQISTTMICSHLSQQQKANAVERLPWAQTQPGLTLVK